MLLARPAVAAWVRLLFLRAPTLRGRLLIGFVIVAVVPILTLPPVIGLNAASSLQTERIAAMEGLVQTVADSLPGMVAERIDDISGLAKNISAIGEFDDPVLTEWLLRYHETNTEFVSIWVAMPDGRVPVATAARNGSAERWGGPIAGVSVMDYFQDAVAQGGEYVSTVRKGVAAGFDPMVFISAPIENGGGQPWGYLQAQLDLRRVFGHFVMQDAKAGSELLITDAQNRVMVSSPRLQLHSFEHISAHPLMVSMQRDPGRSSFGFSGAVEVGRDEGPYVAVFRELPKGWKVIAVASLGPVTNMISLSMLVSALWVLLTILLARGFAGLFGEAVARPLKKLDESLDVFDSERTISIIPQAPSDAPAEVQDVYERVRNSMRQSRDAYRNMMKALNEGEELKRQLREASGGSVAGDSARISVVEGPVEEPDIDMTSTFRGRLDAVTELPGCELFREFFDEAWGLGVVAETSLSLILIAVGSKNDDTLKAVADALSNKGGRTLDLVARIGVHEFAVVLPDTDLHGALAVAERTQLAVRNVLAKISSDRIPETNFAVVSIVPNSDGNAKSFVDVGRRVLKASNKKGDGFIAYADENGKIRLATKADVVDWDQEFG
ncbi:MAG: diguanylate cyclase [Gammaproteobacteria bacterium]|nr:diguanylate cyclase [Gammaproteobacteria bacterium]